MPQPIERPLPSLERLRSRGRVLVVEPDDASRRAFGTNALATLGRSLLDDGLARRERNRGTPWQGGRRGRRAVE